MKTTANTTAMDHVRALSVEIGPRPSTAEGERRAAEYIRGVMEGISKETARVEPFRSPKSGWRPFAVTSAAALAAVALFWFGGRGSLIAAIALNLAAVTCAVLQLLFIPNPLMWFLPKGDSQNVWLHLKTPAGDPPKRRIVISSHYDTHRTPLAYSSPFWIRVFRSLTAVGMGGYVLLEVLMIAALALPPESAVQLPLRIVALFPAAVHVLVLALTLQADMTPHTPGANDNATGVGVLLELAERFAHEPLADTELWFVATGCEEVGLYGMAAFMATHAPELTRSRAEVYAINIDNVGGKHCGPCYIDGETMLATYRSDAKLVALADRLAREFPDLGAYKRSYQGAYTDGAIAIKFGIPTITFLGLGENNWIPNLHQMTDVIEHVDEGVVGRTTDFIEALARGIAAG